MEFLVGRLDAHCRVDRVANRRVVESPGAADRAHYRLARVHADADAELVSLWGVAPSPLPKKERAAASRRTPRCVRPDRRPGCRLHLEAVHARNESQLARNVTGWVQATRLVTCFFTSPKLVLVSAAPTEPAESRSPALCTLSLFAWPTTCALAAADDAPFILGVNGHPHQQEDYRAVSLDQQMDLLRELGVRWYRTDWGPGYSFSQHDVLVAAASRALLSGVLPCILEDRRSRSLLRCLLSVRLQAYFGGELLRSLTPESLDLSQCRCSLVRDRPVFVV